MNRTDVVTVRGLRKVYGGRPVVDGLDLDVPAGQIVGLIGANGAGKTTTAECIQGLRRPDAGTVRVLGLDPARQAGQLRPQLGSQLQDSALPDRLRVGEAVDLFASRPGADGAGLLAQFGLEQRRRSAFAGLSGGERQRLFLVLALLNRPRLVILDELTQGLDPAARRDVWAAVAQLREAGTTVLLVTHELDEAEALCDHVIAMRAGRVLDAGRPAELVARHAAWAAVTFGWPAGDTAALLDCLRVLPGVRAASAARTPSAATSPDGPGDVVTVRGERQIIARVSAELLRRGLVPDDLSVDIPNLESALLGLLGEHQAMTPDLIGASR